MQKITFSLIFLLFFTAVYAADKPIFNIIDNECIVFLQGNTINSNINAPLEIFLNTITKANLQIWYIKKDQYSRVKFNNNTYAELASFDKESISILSSMGNHLPSKELYFRKGITWNAISSTHFCVREHITGAIFSNAGMVCIIKDERLYDFYHGLLNSKVLSKCLTIISPTLNYNAGDIKKMPIKRHLFYSFTSSSLYS